LTLQIISHPINITGTADGFCKTELQYLLWMTVRSFVMSRLYKYTESLTTTYLQRILVEISAVALMLPSATAACRCGCRSKTSAGADYLKRQYHMGKAGQQRKRLKQQVTPRSARWPMQRALVAIGN
jgi:hypothetical protein